MTGRLGIAVVLLLAGVAGFVDAAAYIALGHLYVAHLTGDINHIGRRLGRGDVAAVLPAVATVALFVGSIAAASVAIELVGRRGSVSPLAVALGVESVLVAGLLVSSHAGFYVVLALAVCAMGVQTAAVTRHGSKTVRTTYMSGMSTRLAQQLANVVLPPPRKGERSFLRDELGLETRTASLRRAGLLLLLLGAFVAGATAGAVALVRGGFAAFAVPLALLLAACVAELRRFKLGGGGRPR